MWLAIYIPALPLQAFSHAINESGPVVIYERDARLNRVVAINRNAAHLGIQPDRTLAEANALSDRLISLCREPSREQALLQRLATAINHLTPNIHISETFGLLLEVSGSLTLFGNAQSLLNEALIALDKQRVRTHAVIAPSARGARWLARAHRQLVVTEDLAEWLDDLPLFYTDFSRDLIRELQDLNLHNLAAVKRLPPGELGKRYGLDLPQALAQAYGLAAQHLAFWQPHTYFRETVEFMDLAREQSHWMPGITILLQQLQRFLLQRTIATKSVLFIFFQGTQQHTNFHLSASHGTHSAKQWQQIFEVRLERIAISHEISSIELRCEYFEPIQFTDLDFFDRSHDKKTQWESLLALIKTRVGMQSLVESPHSNHNALPESVVSLHGDTATSIVSDSKSEMRPVWLIDPPRKLQNETVRKLFASVYLQHPERVRENWSTPTSDVSVERDYYIAYTPDYSVWWIFRTRAANDWYLHGIFA